MNVNDLLNRLISSLSEQLDNAQQCKNSFHGNFMRNALFQVLCELKNKAALNIRQISTIDDQPCEQLILVDNMIRAEGIFERNSTTDSSLMKNFDQNNHSENPEYKTKLDQLRQIYHDELEKNENNCQDFCSHIKTLLLEQSQIRPVSEQEIEQMVKVIRKKFSIIQLQLKQNTCEALMILRSKSLDARRKRRNFSKFAIQTLNEYFYSHLSNPYPTDEVKEELARQCGISIAQVTNWFGNKRIRYKKNMHKTRAEANVYAAQAIRHNSDHLSFDF